MQPQKHVILLSREEKQDNVQNQAVDWLKSFQFPIYHVSPAESRIEFFIRYSSPAAECIHLSFLPFDSIYVASKICNVAFVASNSDFILNENPRLWTDRTNSLDHIFVQTDEQEMTLRDFGVRTTISVLNANNHSERAKHQFFVALRDATDRALARIQAADREAPCSELRQPRNIRTDEWLNVEVSSLYAPHFTGISRFAAQLVHSLSSVTNLRLGIVNSVAEFETIVELPREDRANQDIMRIHPDRDLEAWANAKLKQGNEPRRKKREICHSPLLYTFLRPEKKISEQEISILYDLTTLVTPWAHHKKTKDSFDRLFYRGLGYSNHVLAISRSSCEDTRWLLPEVFPKTSFCYPGPSQCVSSHAAEQNNTRCKNIILVVCTVDPRKNGLRALKWFLNSPVLDDTFELKWVGGKHEGKDSAWLLDLATLLVKSKGRKIEFLGRVTDSQLCELYREATLSMYPSLYEGFGFPVLDSLWHGTPVICSYNSSLKEFACPGVFYFDPCDEASMDLACREALSSTLPVISRTQLSERYSWTELANRIMTLC